MILIVGMGQTGLSVARFLTRHNIDFKVADTRKEPPLLSQFKQVFSDKTCHLGSIDEGVFTNVDAIVLSPGIDRREAFVKQAKKQGIRIIGDMTLFFQYVNAPVIGITGSNGKSTVAKWVHYFIEQMGLKSALGGNIGTPALDCLAPDIDFYVLELSSYQLDLTPNMPLKAATVLNIAADHLERYDSFDDYTRSKLSIFTNAQYQVVNTDEMYAKQMSAGLFTYGLNPSSQVEKSPRFSLIETADGEYLTSQSKPFMSARDNALIGRFNQLNILAAYALCAAIGLEQTLQKRIARVIKTAPRLKHRLQWVATINAVDYYNDSKATNSHAANAAILALNERYRYLVWIIGGELKQEDYALFAKRIESHIDTVVIVGKENSAAQILFKRLIHAVPIVTATKMAAAVHLAAQALDDVCLVGSDTHQVNRAKPIAAVCLSPACASFDLFSSFTERGDAFINAVATLQSKPTKHTAHIP